MVRKRKIDAIVSRRLNRREREDWVFLLRAMGWVGATMDDTPRYVAVSGERKGYGYDRPSAIADLNSE